MGMITCPECGKKISDKATHCIGCGIGMDEIQKIRLNSNPENLANSKMDDEKGTLDNRNNHISQYAAKKQSLISVLLMIICGVCIFIILIVCVLWGNGTLKRKGVFNSIYSLTGLCLSHDWENADCDTPKTCLICNKKIGEAIGHKNVIQERIDAGCITEGGIKYVCEVCGNISEEIIDPLGHDWIEATCTDPRTCSRCGEKEEGSVLGHTVSTGICGRCGKEIAEPILFSGEGDSVISDITFGDGLYSVYFTNLGAGNFIVHGFPDGENKEYWVNESGAYTGYVLQNTGFNNGLIEIQSNGVWSISFQKIVDEGTSNIVGHGNCVSPFFKIDSETCTVRMENSSENGNFIVHIYDEYGNRYLSLANEQGNYVGEKIFDKAQKGTKYCIEVVSDGDWVVDFGDTDEKTIVNNIENRGITNDSSIINFINNGLSVYTYHTVEYSDDGTILAIVTYTNTGRAFDEMLKGNSSELSTWNNITKDNLLSLSSIMQEMIRRIGYENTVVLRIVDDRDNTTTLFEASDGIETFCILE